MAATEKNAPLMKVAEWSLSLFDQSVYRRASSQAGFDPQEVLPVAPSWVLPMHWFRLTRPSLPGYSLPYTCSLFSPSPVVWRWHDAVVDSLKLFDILTTRQMKLFEGNCGLAVCGICYVKISK